jgi:hypothetical protein
MFTPTIVKAIRYLRESGARKNKQDLAAIIEEREEYINKALEKLVAADLVSP